MDFKADFITLFTKIKENILILMKTQGIAAGKKIETIFYKRENSCTNKNATLKIKISLNGLNINWI